MKKTSLALSILLLFAGGCTSVGVSDQMTSNCFGCSYERLPDYKTLVKAFVSKKGSVLNLVDIYEPDYYRGADYWVAGRPSQSDANQKALELCELQAPYDLSCVIMKEGEKDVYEENIAQWKLQRDEQIRVDKKLDSLYKKRKEEEQKRMEEEKRQAFMTELINRCLSFGFEGRKEIASCLQQEVFNEKRLASISRPTYYFEKQEEKGWWEKLIEEALDPERIREAQQDAKIRCIEAGKRC